MVFCRVNAASAQCVAPARDDLAARFQVLVSSQDEPVGLVASRLKSQLRINVEKIMSFAL